MEITLLGTTCMVPTKDRAHSAIFLKYKREGILIDCGEGTQRQFTLAGIPHSKITQIIITHWHGDHVLGLPGLLQTIAFSNPDKELKIFGPKGTKERFSAMQKAFIFDRKLNLSIKEVGKSKVYEDDDFFINTIPLEHGIPTIGIRVTEKDKRKINMVKAKKLGLAEGPEIGKITEGKTITKNGKKIKPDDISKIEKGKIVSIISDTNYCKGCLEIADNADILICESSFTSELEEKASEHNHLTAKQAASIASQTNVKKLILTHISPRYKTPEKILEDAKEVFPNTIVGYDFQRIKLI